MCHYVFVELDSIHLHIYADESFETNTKLIPQLGYMVVLSDKFDNAHAVDFCSKKEKRIVISIMAGEFYALVESFDASFSVSNHIHRHVL